MATLRAILRRVRWVHRDKRSTGPRCLVRKQIGELTPGGVMDTLGQTMVMHHAVDRQVLNRDQIKGVDDAAALLVGEVAATPGSALIHACHDCAPLRTCGRALLFLGETALCLGERLLFLAEEAGIDNRLPRFPCLPGAEHSEGLEPHVNAYLLAGGWQWGRLGTLARKRDVPLARATAADGRRLGCAFQGAMVDQLDASDVHH